MTEAPRDEATQLRKRHGVARTYATDRIEVTWEPRLCVHVGYKTLKHLGIVDISPLALPVQESGKPF